MTAIVLYTTGLVVLAAATTSAYLGMRDVMEIGGSCASGGPYEVATPCPEGTAVLMVGGIFGWFLGAGLTAVAGSRLPGSYGGLALLAWPGLFLSLGWNFLDFGLDPPGGGGADAGLVFCGVLFVLMGGVPLVFGLKAVARTLWPDDATREPSGVWSPSGQLRAATSRVRPVVVDAPGAAASGAPSPTPEDAVPQDAAPGFDAPPDTAGGRGDVVDDLERLADLHGRGAIDDDEFARAKDLLLDAGEDRR